AERIIREQLTVRETPLLFCYLGDVTKDYECYERAWSLSKNSFSRAKKSMGLWWLGRREFEKSLEHFETSLEINPLQIGLWFTYGCAGLSCGRFEKAATAFRRCVNLDNDNFEAWNNLATAYIRSHNKPRAFVTLQEAIKCEYENWRLWENYLIISVDIGQFEETIRAYHRLLELKQKHVDVEVLSNLTKAVCTNLKDASGEHSSKLKGKLLALFGHITSQVTGDGCIWRLYAELTNHVEPGQNLSQSEQEKVIFMMMMRMVMMNF
ncbi:hypothetical protein HELRODRAFT_86233, partial [Helobdella robusta]|uniref:Uncharacterized protein n=1 Tax=Helobdella robusta TaxID=6412 RepID=T1G690_HELRO